MDHGDWWRNARDGAGVLGAFLGAMLFRKGLKERKRDRNEVPAVEGDSARSVSRSEWHDLRDFINRLSFMVEELQRDLGRVEGKTDKDHERLSTAMVELSLVRQQLETMSDHCDHCPGHGRQR